MNKELEVLQEQQKAEKEYEMLMAQWEFENQDIWARYEIGWGK